MEAALTPQHGMQCLPETIDRHRQIKPGMNKEEMDRIRQEIARIAAQSLRGM